MVKLKMQMFYIAILAIVYLTSCNEVPLIHEFPIGMSEKDLSLKINEGLIDGKFVLANTNDSNEFYYNWKLTDTSLFTKVSFNQDGVIDGKLRITVINLNDSTIVKDLDESLDEIKMRDAAKNNILALNLSPTKSRIIYSTCPKVKLDKVLLHLHELYGKVDSIIVDRGWNNDTAYVKYYFHYKNSEIILRRENILPPSVYIPFSHTASACVYQLSKSYDSEFNEIREMKRKQLKPADIIRVPISYRIERNVDKYGYEEITLPLTIDISIMNRRTLLESRSIRSMKGSIVIKDEYDELLQSIDDIEYDTHDLNSQQPGIVHALGGEIIATNSIRYNAALNIKSRTIPLKFKSAVLQGQAFSLEFIPNAIKFSDGAVLKD